MAKKARPRIFVDMTPMVDVIMLLLTFFMLTTQFRPPQEVEVTLPSSHSAFKVPESDIMTVLVGQDGRIFLNLDSQLLRAKIFGEENKLKAGIQVSDKEMLADLMVRARMTNPKLRTVVRGDKAVRYAEIEDVMNVLQETNITRFSLVTELDAN
jgi:biopolymer transport protein ExbD